MASSHDAAALSRIPRITARETRERQRRGEDVLIVDVRRDVAHERVHVRGDRSYPARDYERRRGELPKDRLLVLY